jgi:hypothetical protein
MALVGVSLGACSSNATANPWVGSYSCTLDETLQITAPSGTPTVTGSSTLDYSVVAGSNGTVSLSSLADASAKCSIVLSISGTTATVAADQTCVSGGTTVAYAGSLTMAGDYFSGSLALTASGAETGTGTLVYSCDRLNGQGAPYAHRRSRIDDPGGAKPAVR